MHEFTYSCEARRTNTQNTQTVIFDVLLTVHLSIFISVINQIDAHNFCFTISLFHASTCFKYMYSSSGGQNCITQPLVSSHQVYFMPLHVSSTCNHHQEVKIALHSLWYHHTYRCDDTRVHVLIIRRSK